jgi:UDP-2,3-diacylglucosamine pyrophosphatase LpxH
MAAAAESNANANAMAMDRVYRFQRHIYDLTRKYYLFGRDRVIADLDAGEGDLVLELGAGTARNLIKAARRYPKAHFFGVDISGEMLCTAATAIERRKLGARIRLARADATGFDGAALFGEPRFDRIMIAYSLSMIPAWEAAAGGRFRPARGLARLVPARPPCLAPPVSRQPARDAGGDRRRPRRRRRARFSPAAAPCRLRPLPGNPPSATGGQRRPESKSDRRCAMTDAFHLPRRYRAIWISDFHIGPRRAQTELLLEFLRHTESDLLYLVGDVVDNWSLKKTWYWDQKHNDVIQKLLRKARKGTRIIYIPGNHDEHFHDFAGTRFGRIRVAREAIHTTADKKRYLVLHGDQFDGVVKYAKWLALLGDQAYERAIDLNRVVNAVRRRLGLPYWSLSSYLKRRVKQAVQFVSEFEKAVVREARKRKADGVICGHIHTPELRQIGDIHYCNDGDWVESCSALVEHQDGRFELIHWLTERVGILDASPVYRDQGYADHHRDRRLAPAG